MQTIAFQTSKFVAALALKTKSKNARNFVHYEGNVFNSSKDTYKDH